MSDTAVFEWKSGAFPEGARRSAKGLKNWAPAIRIPVTRGNRERLRALRAEELRAWNERGGDARAAEVKRPRLQEVDRDAKTLTVLLGAAAVAVFAQSDGGPDLAAIWARAQALMERLAAWW
jgi:hypothetical protein